MSKKPDGIEEAREALRDLIVDVTKELAEAMRRAAEEGGRAKRGK